MKKMEEYISGKPEIKKYLYQKLNKNFDLNLKKIYVAENKKRKKRMEPMELANIIQFEKNYEVQKIIDKTIKQLYEEYINSDEFKINEINRLKYVKKENDEYIKTYKEVSKKLLEFFFN